MCLTCAQVIKEQLEPKYFWIRFHEIEDDHVEELLEAVKKTSAEYQAELSNEFLRET